MFRPNKILSDEEFKQIKSKVLNTPVGSSLGWRVHKTNIVNSDSSEEYLFQITSPNVSSRPSSYCFYSSGNVFLLQDNQSGPTVHQYYVTSSDIPLSLEIISSIESAFRAYGINSDKFIVEEKFP